jgi:hypothetical protein
MCDAACGEPIARAGPSSNVRDRAGAKTLKGLSRTGSRASAARESGGVKRVLIDTPRRRQPPPSGAGWAKRAGGVRAKSRTRHSPANPSRAKPKGAASGRQVNPRPVARDSRKGESPETAACWAGLPLRRRDYRQVKRYVGSLPRKRGEYLPRGESSAGQIPRAPPV